MKAVFYLSGTVLRASVVPGIEQVLAGWKYTLLYPLGMVNTSSPGASHACPATRRRVSFPTFLPVTSVPEGFSPGERLLLSLPPRQVPAGSLAFPKPSGGTRPASREFPPDTKDVPACRQRQDEGSMCLKQ